MFVRLRGRAFIVEPPVEPLFASRCKATRRFAFHVLHYAFTIAFCVMRFACKMQPASRASASA
ncbi:hypothetical protein BRPE64_DCDS03600 (plasmid) [Caballeronia insecticola]|uniref:Uncharacterized protein n=1 Tax=Caballeronia insecticola TaxID=758793 RepID=R4X3B9_9BURK|nr:hypothetical protein BRPE64_DCDS03600 [Caballeronia insecticola]